MQPPGERGTLDGNSVWLINGVLERHLFAWGVVLEICVAAVVIHVPESHAFESAAKIGCQTRVRSQILSRGFHQGRETGVASSLGAPSAACNNTFHSVFGVAVCFETLGMTKIPQHVLAADAATHGVRRTDGAVAVFSIHDFLF